LKVVLRSFVALALTVLAADLCCAAEADGGDKPKSLIDKKTAAATELTPSNDQKGDRRDAAPVDPLHDPAMTDKNKIEYFSGKPSELMRGRTGLIDKRSANAMRLTRPHNKKGSQPDSAPADQAHDAATTDTDRIEYFSAPGAKKAGASLIDKKTAIAIGLIRPHKPHDGWHQTARVNYEYSGAQADHALNASPTLRERHLFDGAAFATRQTHSFAGPEVSPLLAHQGAMPKSFGAAPNGKVWQPSATSGIPRYGFTAHDSVIGSTVMKHSPSMLVAVGGPTKGRGTAALNGTDMRAKQPH
jgi:hypothetical protein